MKKVVLLTTLFGCCSMYSSMTKDDDRSKKSLPNSLQQVKRDKSSTPPTSVRRVDSLDELKQEVRKEREEKKPTRVVVSSEKK